MPELPEVETTRQGLRPLLGKRITAVTVRNAALRQPVPENLPRDLTGNRVESLMRRSKYLILETATGSAIVHLGMSGSLRLTPQQEPPRKHDHLLIDLEDGLSLRFHDPRRFGLFLWTAAPWNEHVLMAALGPEPLENDFTPHYLYQAGRNRRVAVKSFLMDNRVVVGVGNIYAAETLFRTGIHPLRTASSLTLAECAVLHARIREILAAAITRGGTTLRDFVNGQGNPGYFQQELSVYGREGLPCLRCGLPLERAVIGGRSSVFCPKCQPLNPERLA